MNAVIFKESATSVLGSKMESSSKLNVMISGATGTYYAKINIVTMKRKTDRNCFFVQATLANTSQKSLKIDIILL
jgi:hypothetical protein